eukprot:11657616-Ditylum_brightwellii.AAC.1
MGWLVNGQNYKIQLPDNKCEGIVKLIKKVLHTKATPLNRFQELSGKLQHTSLGIPGGHGLFSPLHMAMLGNPDMV